MLLERAALDLLARDGVLKGLDLVVSLSPGYWISRTRLAEEFGSGVGVLGEGMLALTSGWVRAGVREALKFSFRACASKTK
ncbi:hypothetical protein ACWDKQ_10165 [Saccharopolyspora sp. NPDC000995]